jgi:3-dehydroquinate synthase
MPTSITVRTKTSASGYDVRVAGGSLVEAGIWASRLLGPSARAVCVVTNRTVMGLYGETVNSMLKRNGFKPYFHLIEDGEGAKSFGSLADALTAFGKVKLARTDAVIALGGGVAGDLAGFAASIYLRGVAFLQVPTTLLSMIDSSVGGKTGINTQYGKNLVGSFYQPRGVLIDPLVLGTLPDRELTAGFCEAVKQGALAGRKLLDLTEKVLEEGAEPSSPRFEKFLADQIKFKASIVVSDEREAVGERGSRSRKILNFGHTFAHALEKVTDYRYLKHGEAVGWGILFAAELSKKLELMEPDEVESLNDVVHRAGILPPIGGIDPSEILEAFKHDKKNIGDSLQWVLLRGIGNPVIVPGAEIPASLIRSTVRKFTRTTSRVRSR